MSARAGAESFSSGAASTPTTWAPDRSASSAAATPLSPRPTTATTLPARFIIFAGSPKLHGGKAHQREQERNDPKANDDLRLGPTLLLVVVVDGGHEEHS